MRFLVLCAVAFAIGIGITSQIDVATMTFPQFMFLIFVGGLAGWGLGDIGYNQRESK